MYKLLHRDEHFILMKCDCEAINSIDDSQYDITDNDTIALKDGVTITCESCGATHSSSECKELPLYVPTPKIRCPYCGSGWVNKIGVVKKYTSFAVMGVFSSNFGRQYECNNCKSKF